MASLEFVQTYLDDLLCISKGSLEDHLRQIKKGLHQVARHRLDSECTQVVLLCRGDRIPRICIVLRWYQTTTKKGTGHPRISATSECETAPYVPGHGPVLQRHLGTAK